MLNAKILVLFLLFAVCPGLGQTGHSTSEYAVYGAVLRTIYTENRRDYANKSHFVIIDRTLKSDAVNTPTSRRFSNLVNKFEKLNSSEYSIERKLPPGEYSKEYHLISPSDLDELFLDGKREYDRRIQETRRSGKLPVIDICGSAYWHPFYQKFPEASGHYRLSRVAISGSYALVRIQREDVCGGFDTTDLLLKTKKGWRVIWSAGSQWVA
ncbi:MAG TPA: hypothetical protein PLK77_05320 [Pyrinomonadaceae bacterium]|nr:hypothetical protein [Pyrinomonadaceae bacterium]